MDYRVCYFVYMRATIKIFIEFLNFKFKLQVLKYIYNTFEFHLNNEKGNKRYKS